MTRVVIAGGHGKIALILERLLTQRGDSVAGFIRNPEHSADLEAAGAAVVVLDLEQASVDEVAAHLEAADAVVFAGGIGENSPAVRARICGGLEWLGISVDETRNAAMVGSEGRIDAPSSRVQMWVIPTDEELLIARDTWRVVTNADIQN